MSDQLLLSIVIPVFNEEESLPALFERLEALLAREVPPRSHQIVAVAGHRSADAHFALPYLRLAHLARGSVRLGVLDAVGRGHQSVC